MSSSRPLPNLTCLSCSDNISSTTTTASALASSYCNVCWEELEASNKKRRQGIQLSGYGRNKLLKIKSSFTASSSSSSSSSSGGGMKSYLPPPPLSSIAFFAAATTTTNTTSTSKATITAATINTGKATKVVNNNFHDNDTVATSVSRDDDDDLCIIFDSKDISTTRKDLTDGIKVAVSASVHSTVAVIDLDLDASNAGGADDDDVTQVYDDQRTYIDETSLTQKSGGGGSDFNDTLLNVADNLEFNSNSSAAIEEREIYESMNNSSSTLRTTNTTANSNSSSCISTTEIAEVDDLDDLSCFICGEVLNSIDERESHLNKCLDTFESNSLMTQLPSDEAFLKSQMDPSTEGLRSAVFYCVICDISLSRLGIFSRCQHLKRCAKMSCIPTKDLLALVAPVYNEGDYKDEDDDDGDDNDNDDNCNDEGQDTRAENEDIASNANKNLGENDKMSIDDTMGNPSKGKEKNAWTIMMNSSKALSLKNLGGGFIPVANGEKLKGKANMKSASSNSNSNSNSNSKSSYRQGGWKSKGKSSSSYGSSNQQRENLLTGYAPKFKKIQIASMTKPIVVDGFQYSSSELTDCYFLTHFHSDHYIGLDQSFDCGKIYCSPTTAGLVKLNLRIRNKANIIALKLEEVHKIVVGGVTVNVVLVDAGHCPGAVCILFVFDNGKRILHTGDFRWNKKTMGDNLVYQSLCPPKGSSKPQNNLTVYLDTTYCDPKHTFPEQSVALDQIKATVMNELSEANSKKLFVFGAYGIGKEKVYMSVALMLNKKVFVDKARYKTMLCYDWPMSMQEKLTTDPNATNIWVVPLSQVNFHNLANLLERRRDCDSVIAFQPTGWTFPSTTTSTKAGVAYHSNSAATAAAAAGGALTTSDCNIPPLVPRVKDKNKIYSVPYSEHSSFTELVDFISTFRPSLVIPTVNCKEDQVKQQLDFLREASGVYS